MRLFNFYQIVLVTQELLCQELDLKFEKKRKPLGQILEMQRKKWKVI